MKKERKISEIVLISQVKNWNSKNFFSTSKKGD